MHDIGVHLLTTIISGALPIALPPFPPDPRAAADEK